MPRQLREVVFVDGVRTPFGKAKGQYAETRADDLVIKCIRELMRRNPGLPPERVDEVAIAATTQIGDQGLTIGRTAALLAGLPQSVPGFAIDRMCAGAMTAVTTTAAGIAFGSYDVVIAGGVEHMGRHPMGEGVDPNPRIMSEKLVDPEALVDGQHRREPARPLPRHHQGPRGRLRAPLAGEDRRRPTPTARSSRTWCRSRPLRRGRLGAGHRRRAAAPADHAGGPGRAEDAVPRARAGDRRATPPASTTAPPPPCSPTRRPPRELGLPVRMRLVSLLLRRRRARGDGRRADPGDREGAAAGRPHHRRHRAFEVNEAFAVQVLAFLEHFGIADDDARVNPYGGAIAVGHPLASSGVRLMTQLARQLRGAPRRPLRAHHHVHRHRHGRHRDLGEPALHRRGRLMSDRT